MMDRQTAVLGGASGHMFGQEMGVSSPDRGGGKIESPSSDRVLDLQQMPTHKPCCFRGSMTQDGSGSSLRGRMWRAGFWTFAQ